MTRPIRDLWQSYRHEVLPPEAGESQIRETRRAFYGGAQALLSAIMAGLDQGSEPTEADLSRMDTIVAELRDFNRSIEDGTEDSWDHGVS